MVLNDALIVLDILLVCAAIAMTAQAFKAHQSLHTKVSFAFLTSFALISVGAITRLITDITADVTIITVEYVTGITSISVTAQLLLLVGALCLLSAYTLLLLVVEGIKKLSMWILVFLLVITTVFLARDVFIITHVLAIVLVSLLSHHFYENYRKRKQTNALIVYLSFLSILLGHLSALLSVFSPAGQITHLVLLFAGFFGLFAVSWRITHG